MFVLFCPPAENLDAMIAMQTKNKLGKSLVVPDISGLTGNVFLLNVSNILQSDIF